MVKTNEQATATIAANLAATTASKAADLATAAAATATNLASKTAETTAVIGNDITWIKGKIQEVGADIKDIKDNFVNKSEFIEVVRVQEDHERRTRNIESNMWKWMGAISVITSILTIAVGFILKLIQ